MIYIEEVTLVIKKKAHVPEVCLSGSGEHLSCSGTSFLISGPCLPSTETPRLKKQKT